MQKHSTNNVVDIPFFKKIIDLIPGHIYWKNTKFYYLGCNHQQAKSLGLASPEEIVGKTDYDLSPRKEADLFRKSDKRVIKEAKTLTFEETIVLPDGSRATMLSQKLPLFDLNKKIVGLIGISIDITERKNLEVELKESKEKAETASKAKSEFIANMSHDLRTPITGMLGMVQDLLKQADLAKSNLATESKDITLEDLIAVLEEDGSVLMGATDELLQLCNSILEVVRLDSGELHEESESFDVRELALHNKELLEPVARHQLLDFSVEVSDEVPLYLYGVRTYLDRILLNLIGNALKFTEEGFVQVSIALEKERKESYRNGETVNLVIVIEDSGIGIPDEELGSIFDYFSRLTPSYEGLYKGSGLGLPVVERYVNAMNGAIEVDSEEGKGSCFRLTIPLVVSDHSDYERESIRDDRTKLSRFPRTETKKSKIQSTEIRSDQVRILVVEDNELAAKSVALVFSDFPCVVEIAVSGEEALNAMNQKKYDFIFMDIGLPGISGIEVTKAIRSLSDLEKATVPIVAYTAHVSESDQALFYEAGMDAIVSKPASSSLLLSMLERYVPQFSEEKSIHESNVDIEASETGTKQVGKPLVLDWEASVAIYKGNEQMTRDLLVVFAK